jgi:hypothetical protein
MRKGETMKEDRMYKKVTHKEREPKGSFRPFHHKRVSHCSTESWSLQSYSMRCIGQGGCMEEERNLFRRLVGVMGNEGKRQPGRPRRRQVDDI